MSEHKDDPESPDPMGEARAAECDAAPAQCDAAVEDLDGEGPEPTWRDEVADQFSPEPIAQVMSPVDGLPQAVDTDLDAAPPFTREHLVCLEDDRFWVELFGDDDGGALKADGLVVLTRSRFDKYGNERGRLEFPASMVQRRFGRAYVPVYSSMEKLVFVEPTSGQNIPVSPDADQQVRGWVPVRPRRPRCRYYKRQVMPHQAEDQPSVGRQTTEVLRNCTMRRSIGGAFLSLKNEACYACDYRDPPDPETVKRFLDEPQRKKLEQQAHLNKVPMFGM